MTERQLPHGEEPLHKAYLIVEWGRVPFEHVVYAENIEDAKRRFHNGEQAEGWSHMGTPSRLTWERPRRFPEADR